jgi:hypothetical protein
VPKTSYLGARALAGIERLEVELREGGRLTVCDYDGDEGNPTWLVIDGVAHFDPKRGKWQIGYTMDDVHWEQRET